MPVRSSETASTSSTKHNRDVGPLRSFRTNQRINHSINQPTNVCFYTYRHSSVCVYG